MNIVSKTFCLVLASAAVVLTGCSKKPKRPDPSATVLGPTGGGGGSLNPADVNAPVDLNAGGLQARDPNIIETDDMIKGMFQPVYFDLNESTVKASERSKLQDAAKYLTDHPGQRILLEGHCDWRGTAEYNLSLGDRRSNAAKKYLSTIAPANKVETLSKGSLEATQQGDEATMAKDRRVDIIILKK